MCLSYGNILNTLTSCSNYKSEYGSFMIHFYTLNVFTDLGISLSLNLIMCFKGWRELHNCNTIWAIFKYEMAREREEGTREEGGSSFNISSSMSYIFTDKITMVDSMMTWGVKDVFKRSKRSHNLCMNPELIKHVKLSMNTENWWRNS